ncbi:metalloregulator ArsR/SmtB family transcription factor [Leucobacter sp.]
MTNTETMLTDRSCPPGNSHAMGAEAATTISATLKAIADPLRLRMLSAIMTDPSHESCVCDLAELANVSQPTVSHHLKVLKETGLLLSERRGTWVYYRVDPTRHQAVLSLMEGFAPAAVHPDLRASDADADPQAKSDLDTRVTHLAQELADEQPDLDRDLVFAVVRESHASLARTARVTQHLIPLTERFARQRLADISRDRAVDKPQVLFVCVANAGRSQLAAALVNRLSEGRVVARSAGSAPAGVIHPHVRSILTEIEGDGAEDRFPKPLTDDAVRAADVIITMGCGDVCPIIPGVQYEDWAVGDPALASPEGVKAIRNDIENRVRDLLATLQADNTKVEN